MKKTDIAMIVLIASLSVLVSFFVTNSILGGAERKDETVPTITAISTTIEAPDTAIFNDKAINPAVEVQVGRSGK